MKTAKQLKAGEVDVIHHRGHRAWLSYNQQTKLYEVKVVFFDRSYTYTHPIYTIALRVFGKFRANKDIPKLPSDRFFRMGKVIASDSKIGKLQLWKDINYTFRWESNGKVYKSEVVMQKYAERYYRFILRAVYALTTFEFTSETQTTPASSSRMISGR